MLTWAQNHGNDTVRISQLVPACVFLFSPGQWKLCSLSEVFLSPSPPHPNPGCRSERWANAGGWPVQEGGDWPWPRVFPVIRWKLGSGGGEGPTSSEQGDAELTGASPASLSRHPTAWAGVYPWGNKPASGASARAHAPSDFT